MGIISRFFEKRSMNENNMIALLRSNLRGGGVTASGVYVTPENSLQVMAVYACVRILAESLASLPWVLFERDGRNKQRAVNHPLYPILHDLPNPEMTSMELRETLMGHLVLRGNAYASKVFDGAGRIIEIWPLRPDRVEVARDPLGELVYVVTLPSGEKRVLAAYEVMHIRGLSSDGLMGYSPITLARQAVGLALATEEYGARFFSNGAKPSTVITHPKALSDKAYNQLVDSWNAMHQGLENAHRVAILEEGAAIQQIGLGPEDAQFLQTRKYQKSEIAGLFRVPPHMLADLEHATFSNIEHQSLEFVIHTLRPWVVRWEQAANRDLLTPTERKKYFTKFIVDALLRGDINSRYTAYATAKQNGIMSANEIRELEDLNPYEGGDVYLSPLNMTPVDQLGQQPDQAQPDQAQRSIERRSTDGEQTKSLYSSRNDLTRSFIPLFRDIAGRVVRREVNDLRRAVDKYLRKRSQEDFKSFLDQFYRDFPAIIDDNFRAALVTLAAAVAKETSKELGKDLATNDEIRKFIDEYLANWGKSHAASSRHQIEALLDEAPATGEDPASLIDERLDSWEESRADDTADHESFNAVNALAIAFYAVAGVKFLRWATSGKSCPFCERMSGKVVGIAEFFVQSGESLDNGQGETMTVRRDTRHAPLHKGCDCQVLAG